MILLDTHVVLWLALEPVRISKRAHARIAEARRQSGILAISGISLLEIATAWSKRRVELSVGIEAFLESVETRFSVVPITGVTCARAAKLPKWFPKDPADRLIVATALEEGSALITADARIRRSKAVKTIW